MAMADTPEAKATGTVGKGSGASILKDMFSEAPMLPSAYLAYTVRLCAPLGKSVKVMFPATVTLSCPSRLYSIKETGLSMVNVKGTLLAL